MMKQKPSEIIPMEMEKKVILMTEMETQPKEIKSLEKKNNVSVMSTGEVKSVNINQWKR